jgi:hypothetical protein
MQKLYKNEKMLMFNYRYLFLLETYIRAGGKGDMPPPPFGKFKKTGFLV